MLHLTLVLLAVHTCQGIIVYNATHIGLTTLLHSGQGPCAFIESLIDPITATIASMIGTTTSQTVTVTTMCYENTTEYLQAVNTIPSDFYFADSIITSCLESSIGIVPSMLLTVQEACE